MAIIYNYPLNSILLAEDMLIGTSTKIVNGQPKNATKNFSIADLTGFIKQNVSLDDVLQVGNTSLLDAKIGKLYLYDTPITDYGNITLNQNRFSFNTVTHSEVFRAQRDMFSSFSASGYRGSFEVSSITANRVWDFPDKSGTVALLSDVPVVTIPTLQQVTDEGNTTTNDIIVSKETGTSYIQVANNDNTLTFQVEGAFGSLIELNDYSANRYGLINSSGLNFEEFGYSNINLRDGFLTIANAAIKPYIYLQGSDGTLTGSVTIKTDLIDDDYIQQLPSASGTIALTSDITTPTLQEVTDVGNTTTNEIIVGTNFTNGLTLNQQYANIGLQDSIYVYQSGIIYSNFFSSADEISTGKSYVASLSAIEGMYLNTFGSSGYVQLKSDLVTTTPRTIQFPDASGTLALTSDIPPAGVTSVGLTMPSAFSVTNSPITSSGDIAVTALGTASQYIRGDGQLATLPTGAGGGSTVAYYLNGSINASVAGYKQLSNTAIIGGGTDFTLTGNGLITQFLTDIGNPNRIEIPGGAWNFEMWFSMSSNGGTPKFYVELLKYNGTTFTTIANNSAVPEAINGGTIINLYLTSLAVPTTTLLSTDRLAIRVYIVDNSGGRTATLHTEDNHLCEIITTFSGGVTSLNGLSANTQYFDVGTSGTDFAISSVTDTHTFNLPTASATNRGALSSTDWSTFNSKQSGKSINTVSINTNAGSASSTDYIYLASGTINITLPTAVGNQNLYTIKNVGTGVITIDTTSSQTIDGSLTAPIRVQYLSLTIISDGANWNII